MSSSSAASLLATFVGRVSSLRSVRDAGEAALSAGTLRQRDLDHLYQSTFLETCSQLEVFQNDLFFGCLLNASSIPSIIPRVRFRHRSEAERVVLGRERASYLSWSVMSENMKRAEMFLSRGRPFSRLRRRARDLATLNTARVVRNSIAHDSAGAIRQFRALPLADLTPARRTPAGFLRKSVENLTQHENLLRELSRIASALAARTDSRARSLLLDEEPYRSGDSASRGTYRCDSAALSFDFRGILSAFRYVLPATQVHAACVACHDRRAFREPINGQDECDGPRVYRFEWRPSPI